MSIFFGLAVQIDIQLIQLGFSQREKVEYDSEKLAGSHD